LCMFCSLNRKLLTPYKLPMLLLHSHASALHSVSRKSELEFVIPYSIFTPIYNS
jgi:hypothetical protein